jgi:hypothetical protein
MTKVAGILLALIVVGIAVTTRTHSAAGPVCPASPTSHTARTVAPSGHR